MGWDSAMDNKERESGTWGEGVGRGQKGGACSVQRPVLMMCKCLSCVPSMKLSKLSRVDSRAAFSASTALAFNACSFPCAWGQGNNSAQQKSAKERGGAQFEWETGNCPRALPRAMEGCKMTLPSQGSRTRSMPEGRVTEMACSPTWRGIMGAIKARVHSQRPPMLLGGGG